MLFNSIEFISLFLPVALAGYYVASYFAGSKGAISWLVVASFFFYGWWSPIYVLLLAGSVLVNYRLGRYLSGNRDRTITRFILYGGVTANLACLGWFKYSYFFIESVSSASGIVVLMPDIILPLGLSFFTFQQIAYLIDCKRYQVDESDFSSYCLFVTFFPQLVAGPIVHHKEIMPQFSSQFFLKHWSTDLVIGITIFSIGLFKKVVIADGIAEFATPVFKSASLGEPIDFFSAWGGALSYTFQLYFDFSGYSDMAVGLGRMFGIRLPINFFSPYKATSIIEFWRRWHVTLSRFLRDYLYFSLGGNRLGETRRYCNLMTVMVLGGLWHGAGWTFVLWGFLHGIYISANHGWRALIHYTELEKVQGLLGYRIAGWFVTFFAVVVAWVFFRAENFDAALQILTGMAGLNGAFLPPVVAEFVGRVTGATLIIPIDPIKGDMDFIMQIIWIGSALAIVLFLPNTYQWMATAKPVVDSIDAYVGAIPAWRTSPLNAVMIGVMLYAAIKNILADVPSEFLYFQF